ncbi:MAG: 50S ribosomal protein L3 [Candidatus Micrarchaeia archaeon]
MRHGSLQYWPHKRAKKRMPRIRNNPELNAKEPVLSNIVAYKAGTTHVMMIDDTTSPSKGMEIAVPCTVVEIPKIEAYGIRFYLIDKITGYKKTSAEFYNKGIAQKLKIKKLENDEKKLDSMKGKLNEISDITMLLVAYPNSVIDQKHPMRFEASINGTNVEEKFNNALKLLGKEITASDVFKSGEYIDVISISKGKGWAGVIKRFGVKRNFHKSTGKIRHGGPLGSFGDARVTFTVPRAGQMGFNYRTEHNKRILKIGKNTEVEQINKKEGFINYGVIKNDFMILKGSIPGSAKRLIRIRKSIKNRNAAGIKEPIIKYIAK